MKKVIFILAFMLMGTVTFANNSEIESKVKPEVIENVSLCKVVVKTVINADFSCTEYHTVVYKGKIVAEFEIERESGCTGTIHFIK